MEHLEDVRPDNWMTRLWRRVKGKVEKRIDEKVDSVLKAWVNDMYNYLSPKFSKLHLNRDEQQM
jgi:phosphoribulokinase